MVNKGTIISITGQIVEVEFASLKPKIHDVLYLEQNPSIKMEVYTSSSASTFYCLAFTPVTNLYRGAKVINTCKPITIPVGEEVLGRVIDLFGLPEDGKEELKTESKKPIFEHELSLENISVPKKILQTGIKTIDFFSPILEGGKVGLFGGAGVGKTMILTEIIHNIVILN